MDRLSLAKLKCRWCAVNSPLLSTATGSKTCQSKSLRRLSEKKVIQMISGSGNTSTKSKVCQKSCTKKHGAMVLIKRHVMSILTICEIWGGMRYGSSPLEVILYNWSKPWSGAKPVLISLITLPYGHHRTANKPGQRWAPITLLQPAGLYKMIQFYTSGVIACLLLMIKTLWWWARLL